MMKSSRICNEPGATGKLSADPVDDHSAAVQESSQFPQQTIISVVSSLDGFALNSSTSPDGNSNGLGEIYRNCGERKSKSVGPGCTAYQSHLSL